MKEDINREIYVLDAPEISEKVFMPREDNVPAPEGGGIITFKAADGEELCIRYHTASLVSDNIFLFHGVGEVASDWDEAGRKFQELGHNLFCFEYRGYGRSNGVSSMSALISDAKGAFNHLKKWLLDNSYIGKIFIMGKSIGSAPAIDITVFNQDTVSGLIIQSGFCNTMPLLDFFGIDVSSMGLTELNGFLNLEKAAEIQKQVLIIHGQDDNIVPLLDAELIHREIPARYKALIVVPGAGHTDIMEKGGNEYFRLINDFIVRLKRGDK